MYEGSKTKSNIKKNKGNNMKNLYVSAGGGLGDFIFTYFKDSSWRKIKNIKSKLGYKVIATIAVHNPGCSELIYTNPYIDSILLYKWYPPGDPKEREWKNFLAANPLAELELNLKETEPKVFLTEKESKLLDEIAKEKYIAIHPFAGLPHRGCLPHPYDGKYKCYPDYKYLQSANAFADQGYKVYFIGRTSNDGVEVLRGFEEKLLFPKEHTHPNVISLINKTSCRVNVEICRRANGFLGSHSSMLSAAWTADIPSLFFYPGEDEHGNRRSVIEHGGTTGTWALSKPFNSYIELNSEGFLNLDHRVPVERLLNLMGA